MSAVMGACGAHKVDNATMLRLGNTVVNFGLARDRAIAAIWDKRTQESESESERLGFCFAITISSYVIHEFKA
jgi:hypothetical protein